MKQLEGWKKMGRWRYFLGLSLLFNLVFIGVGVIKLAHRPNRTEKHASSSFGHYIQQKQAYYASHPVQEGDVVMVGDSHIEFFDFPEYVGQVRNRGIRGDYSAHVAERVATIAPYKPSKLFMEIGVNDLVFLGISPDSVVSNYAKALETMRRFSPDTKVFVQSILPVSEVHPEHPSLSHKNGVIQTANRLLQALCEKEKMVFVDLDPAFRLHGELDPRYTRDGIHLTEEGYRVWARILLPLIKE